MFYMATESENPALLRRVPEALAARPEEISAAIEGLSHVELLRLEKYARYRIKGLGRKAAGREHDDLLREAMAVTLAGNRRWKKSTVDFFTHLVGVMRSISSHWGEQYDPAEARLESEFVSKKGETHVVSPLLMAVSPEPDPERILDAKQQLKKIEKFFATDPTVPRIIQGFRAGLNGLEIQSATGLSKTDYESALRRMRRGIATLEKKGMPS